MCAGDDPADLYYANHLIHYKVGRLIGVLGFSWYDREDMEQELLVHLLQIWPRFDSGRGTTKTFVNCVLNNRLRQMIGRKKSMKRGFGKWTISLNDHLAEKNGLVLRRADTIAHEEYLLQTGLLSRPILDTCELRLDVERVVSGLSPDMQDLCTRLQTQNVSQISAETGVSRHCLYSSIRKLRCIFEEAGLKEYL